jgi:nucleoside-diphosphate-sugar epimerase
MAPADDHAQQEPATILITGGTTATGLALTRLAVAAGYRVAASNDHGTAGSQRLQSAGAIPVYVDALRATSVAATARMVGARTIAHLALTPLNSPPHLGDTIADHADALADGVAAVMAGAAAAGVARVIFPSFAFLYGDGAGVFTEADPLDQGAVFAPARAAEAAVLAGEGVAGYVLRSGLVLGGDSHALQQIRDRLLRGHSVLGGAGRQSWILAEDLAGAIMALIALDSERDERVYNIAMDEVASYDACMDAFGQALGVGRPRLARGYFTDLRLDPFRRQLLHQNTAIDSARFRDAFGWQAQHTLTTAIDRVLLSWRVAPDAAAGSIIAEPPTPDQIIALALAKAD